MKEYVRYFACRTSAPCARVSTPCPDSWTDFARSLATPYIIFRFSLRKERRHLLERTVLLFTYINFVTLVIVVTRPSQVREWSTLLSLRSWCTVPSCSDINQLFQLPFRLYFLLLLLWPHTLPWFDVFNLLMLACDFYFCSSLWFLLPVRVVFTTCYLFYAVLFLSLLMSKKALTFCRPTHLLHN